MGGFIISLLFCIFTDFYDTILANGELICNLAR